MAQYSPEFLAALRYRYEQTDQPMTALAADFGIGITTLQNLVRKHGWTQRSRRLRDCLPSMRLLEEAQALAASMPSPECASARPGRDAGAHGQPVPAAGDAGAAAASIPPLSPQGDETAPVADTAPMPAPAAAAAAASPLSPIERLEALVEKEIAAEEATRAALGIGPRTRHEAERCARTLSVLTQTLQTLHKLRGGSTNASEEAGEPRDMDAMREDLARRIDALIKSTVGAERVALDQQVAELTNDELKELLEIGRERGIQSLLRPPAQQQEGETASLFEPGAIEPPAIPPAEPR
jgi:hypothetical protein